MPYNLKSSELRQLFDRSTFSRGQRYQQEGRVLVAEWDEETKILFGEVEGSGGRVYEQEIYFTPTQNRRIIGNCTCPVGHNCKHTVAVLLDFMEWNYDAPAAVKPPPASALELWQKETLKHLAAGKIVTPTPGNSFILYLLEPVQSNNGQTEIELTVVKSRMLKRGGWGKTRNYRLSDLIGYDYYNSYSDSSSRSIDKEIARLLSDGNSYYSYHSDLRLQGDVGVLVLQRLLASGRCYFKQPVGPALVAAAPKTARFDWSKRKGNSQLKIILDGVAKGWFLIPTDPPWYLDPLQHCCGPIEQPLKLPLFRSLFSMPAVKADELQGLSEFLLRTLPPKSVPLPVKMELEVVTDAPVPHLLLHGVVRPNGSRFHLLRLSFDYGPVTLPPLILGGKEQQVVREQEKCLQIYRDKHAERTAFERLSDANLFPADTLTDGSEELELHFSVDSMAESALSWSRFLEQIPEYEKDGWRVDVDDSFQLDFVTVSELFTDFDESDNDWFGIGLNIDYQGQQIALLPLVVQWLESNRPNDMLVYDMGDNRWLQIPASLLTPVIDTLVELLNAPHLDDAGRLKMPRSQAHNLLQIETALDHQGHQIIWKGGEKVRELAGKLRDFGGIDAVSAPTGLAAELRDYQLEGLAWLQFLREYGFNGILADDMGLGKTIQTLSHLLVEKEAGRLASPVLIVAPTSVLGNWLREAQWFTPALKTALLHGPERSGVFDVAQDYDVLVTSYALLDRDLELHQQTHYHSLILDEAQAIKNPKAKVSQAACAINTGHRLCLTGTPLENHLGELWAQFHFLMPGFLGSAQTFTRLFRTPIEKQQNLTRGQQLQQRIMPFVLRRTKDEVTQELPPKTTMVREAELGTSQTRLYESLRLAMTKKVKQLLQSKGLQNSHIEILDALLKLRQACCDPRLVKLESAAKVKQSAKLTLLLDLLDKLLEEGRRVLIFSQFTSMLTLIEEELKGRSVAYVKLTGQTRKRDSVINRFQSGEVPVFLISLKAGGVGLNLTAADAVIHYDPWWNPAVENQATDRAHRIGQDKPVFVYKLIAKGTVEEKILQLQDKKQRLADSIYGQGDGKGAAAISSEELLALLAPVGEETLG